MLPAIGRPGRVLLAFSLILSLLGVGMTAAYGQKEELTTEAGVLNVPPKSESAPAGLSVEPTLQDSSGDGTLSVRESATLEVTVTNHAEGPAAGVAVWVYPETGGDQVTLAETAAGGSPPPSYPETAVRIGQFESMASGAARTATLSLRAGKTLSGTPVSLAIAVRDEYGFAPEERETLSLATEKGGTPALAVADLRVDGPEGSTLQPEGDTTTVVLDVENPGTGTATAVTADVAVEKQGALVSASPIEVGDLQAGGSAQARFKVAVAGTPESVPVRVQLRGQSGRASAEARRSLAVAQPDRPPVVDRDIPSTNMKRPNAVAVVIGIKDYQHADVPSVDYALNDARTVKAYLVETLGYRERNVIVAENASGSELRRLFGTESNPKGQLYNYVQKGESEVFVYYSGHGAPDPETEKAYLLGADTNPNYMSINGYPVNQLYQNLAKIPSKSVTVALDACFSGVSESGQIVQNVSPAVLSVENPMVGMENGLAFTAGAADQVSSWYPEKKHGLFTYYFLRGLRGGADADGNAAVTAKEMESYLTEEVPYWARRMHNREQVPQVVGRDKSRVLVRYANAVPASDQK